MSGNHAKPMTTPRRFLPAWLRSGWGLIGLAAGLYAILFIAWIAFHWGGEENVILIGDLANLPIDLVAALAAWRVARNRQIDRRVRRAWLIMGIALFSYFIADTTWAYIEVVLKIEPFPTVADLFYQAFYPLMLIGLLSLPTAPLNRRERWEFLLDLSITLLTAAMLTGYFIVRPILADNAGDPVALVIATAYPIGDLVVLAGIIALLLRRPDRDTRAALIFLVLGIGSFIAADMAFNYTSIVGTYETGGWVDPGWIVAQAFFIWAALRQMHRSPAATEPLWQKYVDQITKVFLALAIAFGYALVVFVGLSDFDAPTLGLITSGAVILTILVIGRQIVSPRFAAFSLRAKLIMAFLGVALVPLALQGALNFFSARQTAINDANRRLASAASQTATLVDGFINSNLDAISNESRLPQFSKYLLLSAGERQSNTAFQNEVASLLATLKDKSIRALSIVQRSQLYVLAYSLVDRDGRVIASTGPNVGQLIADFDYFLQPLETGKPYVSPVLFTPETSIGSLFFTSPVKDVNGQVIGVLVARYNGALLQQLVAASADQAGGQTFAILLDENHLRLAHSVEPQLIFKTVEPLDPENVTELQTARRLPFKPIEELSTNLPEFEEALSNIPVQSVFVTEVGESVELAEKGEILDQAAVSLLKTQPWFVVYAQPQAVFLAPINEQIRGTLLLALAIAAVAAAAAAGVSRLLSRPITRLTAIAEKVTAGDLAAQAVVESNDEVGRLAVAFNSMTDQLRTLIGSLESRVTARTEQLRTGADVGRAAVSVLDAERLLAEVVNLITDRFGYYYAAVFTLDAAGRYAVLREATGDAGRILKERGHRLEVGGQSMVGTVTAQRQAHIALDVGAEAVRFANPLLPDTRSEIALPLVVGDRVLGALDVQSKTAAAFDAESAAVLQNMADQIAVALNNAALFAESKRIAQQSRTLYQASREVGRGEADVNLTITAMMQLAEKQLNYSHWWVARLDRGGQVLQPLGPAGQAIPVVDQPDSPAVRSALHGESIIVNDPEHDPHMQNVPALRRRALGKFVSVPIMPQDEPIGALVLGCSIDSPDLGEADLEVARSLASLAAFAIENRQLHEQTQNALVELDRINRRLTGESWSAYTQGRSQGVLWVSTTDQAQQATLPEVGEALTSGQVTTRSLNGDGQLGVAIPIVLRDTTIGALHIVVPQRAYTAELRSTLESIAGHVAQAAENMRLLEDSESLARRERTINEINSRVRQTIDFDSILKTAVTELGQSLKAARVMARLNSPIENRPTTGVTTPGNGRGDHHA